MNKDWDSAGISFQKETWEAVYRVLKPGALLLAFGGTRTWHRIAIEDAGFEIRDTITWLQGQGFPKSYNVSKGIHQNLLKEFRQDVLHLMRTNANYQCGCSKNCRQCGELLHDDPKDDQDVVPLLDDAQERNHLFETLEKTLEGISHKCTSFSCGLSDHLSKQDYLRQKDEHDFLVFLEIASSLCLACFSRLIVDELSDEDHQDDIDWSSIDFSSLVSAWGKSRKFYHTMNMSPKPYNHYITNIEKFDGYGTALKPAFEPIIVAMKPIDETYVNNALTHGVAGMWIDGGRIEVLDGDQKSEGGRIKSKDNGTAIFGNANTVSQSDNDGRWPANVILDETSAEMLDEQTGIQKGGFVRNRTDGARPFENDGKDTGYETVAEISEPDGGASRFFYCAKASKRERNAGLDDLEDKPAFNYGSIKKSPGRTGINTPRKNTHATVKPLALMEYLCKLTRTPTGGIVLDPFMGSGTCVNTDRDFIGIELIEEYYQIARKRIEHAQETLIKNKD
jgi:hypothetical protein